MLGNSLSVCCFPTRICLYQAAYDFHSDMNAAALAASSSLLWCPEKVGSTYESVGRQNSCMCNSLSLFPISWKMSQVNIYVAHVLARVMSDGDLFFLPCRSCSQCRPSDARYSEGTYCAHPTLLGGLAYFRLCVQCLICSAFIMHL